MNEIIYRQDAIDSLANMYCKSDSEGYVWIIRSDAWAEIDALPPAQLECKKGKWIKIPEFCGDDVSGFIDNHFSCSECKKEAEINPWGFYILSDFCPNCGVDMREVNNEQLN